MGIRTCATHSGECEPGAYKVTNSITTQTTPQEFDTTVGAVADYALSHGGRCGWNALGIAASLGNHRLVRHIAESGGAQLLNLGNSFGWTPLLCATTCNAPTAALHTVQTLIALGADINLATSTDAETKVLGEIPCGVTPLWIAAERQNFPLVRVFLERGAIIPQNLTELGTKIVETVQVDIKKEQPEASLIESKT